MRHSAEFAPERKPALLSTKIFQPSQEHQKHVKDVVSLSLRILEKMYQGEHLRFCHTIRRDSPHERTPSFRYTAITLLGLDAAIKSGVSVTFPVDYICTDLATRAADEADLGNKALALWAALKLRSVASDKALHAILAHDGFLTTRAEGLVRSTELAWAVYSLALAWLDMNIPGGALLGRNRKSEVKKRTVLLRDRY